MKVREQIRIEREKARAALEERRSMKKKVEMLEREATSGRGGRKGGEEDAGGNNQKESAAQWKTKYENMQKKFKNITQSIVALGVNYAGGPTAFHSDLMRIMAMY